VLIVTLLLPKHLIGHVERENCISGSQSCIYNFDYYAPITYPKVLESLSTEEKKLLEWEHVPTYKNYCWCISMPKVEENERDPSTMSMV